MEDVMSMESIRRSLLAAALCAAFVPAAWAQSLKPATLAWARVDPATVSVQTIAPAEAFALKATQGRAVLLVDVRSREEAAFGGTAAGTDALVPYTEIAHPLQWDAARRDFVRERVPDFVDVMQAWVAALDGDHDTPLLLLCRDGQTAARAARELSLAGFANVRPIATGFEGVPAADGRREGGWRGSLPWQAQVDEALLFGARD
jgi:rhodanese-related sulfurtransferase